MVSLSSDPSDVTTITLSPTACWLKDPLDPTSDLAVDVVEFQRARVVTAARWQPIGATLEKVTRGSVRGYSGTLRIRTLDKATFDAAWSLLARQATLLAQTMQAQYYLEVTGEIPEEDLKVAPLPTEPWPFRFAHILSVPATQVAAP